MGGDPAPTALGSKREAARGARGVTSSPEEGQAGSPQIGGFRPRLDGGPSCGGASADSQGRSRQRGARDLAETGLGKTFTVPNHPPHPPTCPPPTATCRCRRDLSPPTLVWAVPAPGANVNAPWTTTPMTPFGIRRARGLSSEAKGLMGVVVLARTRVSPERKEVLGVCLLLPLFFDQSQESGHEISAPQSPGGLGEAEQAVRFYC